MQICRIIEIVSWKGPWRWSWPAWCWSRASDEDTKHCQAKSWLSTVRQTPEFLQAAYPNVMLLSLSIICCFFSMQIEIPWNNWWLSSLFWCSFLEILSTDTENTFCSFAHVIAEIRLVNLLILGQLWNAQQCNSMLPFCKSITEQIPNDINR